jgi:tRNA threonylcarbamoyladenosine biosynthesis protein TsaB
VAAAANRRPPVIRALALETSGRLGSVALAEDGVAVAVERFDYGLQNAARILLLIDGLCRAHRWTPSDPRQLYISIGPGSFTGLRIAVTLAKTLAFVTGAAVIPVQTVDVLAQNAPAEARELIIVLDAKRGQIFTSRLIREAGIWKQIEPPHLDRLPDVLARAGRPVHLLGEGIPYHRDAFTESPEIIATAPDTWIGRAEVVASLGYQLALGGNAVDLISLVPLYIRRPEAEEKLDALDASSAVT